MEERLKKIKETLKANNQEHLLQFYDKMTTEDKEKLIEQIENIDFNLMNELYENAKKKVDFEKVSIEPIEHVDKAKLTVAEKKMYEEKGIDAIKSKNLQL